jgi:hypothetical protein
MGSLLRRLGALWRGELPLEVAFWHYAIYYGLFVNLATSTVAIVLFLNDAPVAVFLAVHLLSVPYSILTAVGVWQSAASLMAAPASFANFARIGVIAWFCLWLAV